MTDFVKVNQIYLDNPATTVDEVFDFLAQKAVENGLSDDAEAVVAGFREREQMGSTGMQSGIALPHCKSAAVNDAAIYVVKFAGDIEWESLDGRPITMAIALFAPDGDVHLSLLSSVATVLLDESFRSKIRAAETPQQLADAINAGLNAGNE